MKIVDLKERNDTSLKMAIGQCKVFNATLDILKSQTELYQYFLMKGRVDDAAIELGKISETFHDLINMKLELGLRQLEIEK